MKLYPINETEKLNIYDSFKAIKQQNNITGKTIQVLDEELSSASNIYDAIVNNDGYIYALSANSISDEVLNKMKSKPDECMMVKDKKGGMGISLLFGR